MHIKNPNVPKLKYWSFPGGFCRQSLSMSPNHVLFQCTIRCLVYSLLLYAGDRLLLTRKIKCRNSSSVKNKMENTIQIHLRLDLLNRLANSSTCSRYFEKSSKIPQRWSKRKKHEVLYDTHKEHAPCTSLPLSLAKALRSAQSGVSKWSVCYPVHGSIGSKSWWVLATLFLARTKISLDDVPGFRLAGLDIRVCVLPKPR